MLLEKGADIEHVHQKIEPIREEHDYEQKTALGRAATYGHEATVRFLLEKGAVIEDSSRHLSALYDAVSGGHEAIVRLLLEKGAKIDCALGDPEKIGTILRRATDRGYKSCIKLLLDYGADTEPIQKYSALYL